MKIQRLVVLLRGALAACLSHASSARELAYQEAKVGPHHHSPLLRILTLHVGKTSLI
jgi:hypothetical protein